MTLAIPFRVHAALALVAHRLGRLPRFEDMAAVPVEQRRAQQPQRWVVRPRPAGLAVTERVVPGRAGPVPVRVYARTAPSGRALVYIHGGGFSVGGLDACDHICADLAQLTGDVVVSVDYRLAPEDPFPAGLDDCEDALRWVLDQADELGVSPDRVAVGGDSAGGNLAAALCLRRKEQGDPALTRQVLVYPMLDLTCSRDSWITEAAPYLTRERAAEAVARYYGDADVKDPQVSPLLADDLTGLPPALVLVAQHDTLHDDGVDYARALDSAGVPTRLVTYDRMPHGFLSFPRLTANYDRALRAIADFLASEAPGR